MGKLSELGVTVGKTTLSFDEGLTELPQVVDAATFTGEGRLVRDKSELVGVPFVVVDWKVNTSDRFTHITPEGVVVGSEFLSITAWLRTPTGGRELIIFNDGGSGIRSILEQAEERLGSRAGLLCKEGLRVSEYTRTLDSGASVQAKTFYLH